MSSEFHIRSVVSHLEAFSEEALDLGEGAWGEQLEQARCELCALLKKVTIYEEKKKLSHQELQILDHRLLEFLGQKTLEMAFDLSAPDYALMLTGRQLSVANRVRYRQRKLEQLQKTDVRAESYALEHERLLRRYDAQVDQFLENSAFVSYFRQEALWESQRLRPLLLEAKRQLLARSDQGSDQFKRIKKRIVRTKKAHWMHEMPGRERLRAPGALHG
jgi:hypothetical protein